MIRLGMKSSNMLLKVSAWSSCEIDKHEYLKGEDL